MARPTLSGHPKFAHLASMVGGRGPARGYLELIWDAAYACGDPTLGDSAKVEAVADWRGEAGFLTASLVTSRFLDPSALQTDAHGKQLQTFAVHDLEDHAPDYVLKRWQREAERKAKGDTIRTVRQRAALKRWEQTDANGKQEQTNVTPPAPAPARQESPPAPARDPEPQTSGADVARLFGRIRCEVTGAGVEWQGTPTAPEKAATMAASITAAEAWSDVEPAMRSFWQQAKAGKLRNADQILRNPSFAFGCWCSEFHGLREALHGKAPAAPPDTSAPRCAWHKLPGTASRRAHHPSASCTDCRHLAAAAGTRESEPAPAAALLPAWMTGPPPVALTEEQRAEVAAIVRPPRAALPPKRLTILLEGEPEPKAASGGT